MSVYVFVKLVFGEKCDVQIFLQLICLGYFRGDNFGEPVEQSIAQQ
jgi:hypothetical protein